MSEDRSCHQKVSEKKIEELSRLFRCFEDTIKELIRSPENGVDDDIYIIAELTFYEQMSRSLVGHDADLSLLF